MTHSVYLGLGSNLGNRKVCLALAITKLSNHLNLIIQSSIYETEPWGYTKQEKFLNQVIKGKTKLNPYDLLDLIKQIENEVGRSPTFRFGPREIDIDILFYDDLKINTPNLTIPHPRFHERAFILIPLADIESDLVHPVTGQTIGTMAKNIGSQGVTAYKAKVEIGQFNKY